MSTILIFLSSLNPFTKILANQEKIMSALTDLQASVTALDAVVDKAIALLADISARLVAAGTDPAALAALKTDIDARTAALSAEVDKDTPAAPAA